MAEKPSPFPVVVYVLLQMGLIYLHIQIQSGDCRSPSWGCLYTSTSERTHATPSGRQRHGSWLVKIPQNVEQRLAEVGSAIPGTAQLSGQVKVGCQSLQIIPRFPPSSVLATAQESPTSTPNTHFPVQVNRGASAWLSHSCSRSNWAMASRLGSILLRPMSRPWRAARSSS